MVFDWLVVGPSWKRIRRAPSVALKRAGITTQVGNHSMRATGITDYLKTTARFPKCGKMANHADARSTQLYDRRADAASLDEYQKVGI
jgi:site-specific recombinase XerD